MAPTRSAVIETGDRSLVGLGVAALGAAFERGEASPVDACALYLERIARHDAIVGAFVALDRDRALREAADSTRRWARGEPRSPIDGVPVAIKANIAVQGLPWTAGVGAWRDRIAAEDADCVTRLRDAGAVILGTLNMDPGALGARSDNPWYGRTRNPHRLDRSAGGSSGGAAAAVAAGLCAAALGTDTMGSVRIPAAACGIVGVVPSVDAIDRRGVVPLAPSFDRVGVLARSVADARAVLGVLVNEHWVPASSARHDHRPLAILSLDGASGPFDRAAYGRLFERLADTIPYREDTTLPGYDADRTADRLLRLVEVEGAVVYRDLLATDPDGLGEPLCSLLRWGAALSAERREEAAQHLATARAIVHAALEGRAGLLTPAVPHPPIPFDGTTPKTTARFTTMASITGLPALVLPLECDSDGLPRSAQVIARTTSEALLLGHRIETCIPPIPPPHDFRW